MTDWNPVEGLKEIAYEDLRVGDEVVQLSFGKSYSRVVISNPKYHGCDSKYYLLSRKVKEPEGVGDIAEIYRPRPRGSEAEQITIYVRTRNKAEDADFVDSKAWVNEENDAAFDWSQIMSFAAQEPGLAIRTYTAKYTLN